MVLARVDEMELGKTLELWKRVPFVCEFCCLYRWFEKPGSIGCNGQGLLPKVFPFENSRNRWNKSYMMAAVDCGRVQFGSAVWIKALNQTARPLKCNCSPPRRRSIFTWKMLLILETNRSPVKVVLLAGRFRGLGNKFETVWSNQMFHPTAAVFLFTKYQFWPNAKDKLKDAYVGRLED